MGRNFRRRTVRSRQELPQGPHRDVDRRVVHDRGTDPLLDEPEEVRPDPGSTGELGAMRRLGSVWFVKLKPRNFRSQGRATALFVLLTWSLSRSVMKAVRLSITRWPARRLRT